MTQYKDQNVIFMIKFYNYHILNVINMFNRLQKKIRNLNFNQYKRQLCDEIKPVLQYPGLFQSNFLLIMYVL